jgi:O-antigen/teichoic acid export membrane protein
MVNRASGEAAIRTFRGVLWSFTAMAGSRLVSLLSMVVLARFLSPHEFGMMAFALVFFIYLDAIGDLGTGTALIFWPDRRHDAAQITFLLNLLAGAVWFGLSISLAPLVAAFFHQPGGTSVLRVLSVSFLIRSVGNTHDALSRKDLGFKARILPEMSLTVTKALVAILLALQGFGVWSLVAGHLAGLTIWTVGMWRITSWRPRWGVPIDLIRPMLRYGRPIVWINVVSSILHHIDLMMVGRMLGTSTLGFYHVANKIVETTIHLQNWAVTQVTFPALSKVRDENGVARSYIRFLQFVSLTTIPAATGLIVLADALVRVLFGTAWTPAVSIVQGLAVYAASRSLGTQGGDVLKAVGKPSLVAWLGALRGIVLLPVLYMAARVSGPMVAWSMAAVTMPSAALSLGYACARVGLKLRQVLRALAPSVSASAVMGAALLVFERMAGPVDSVGGLAGTILLGLTIYLAVLRTVAPSLCRHAWSLLLSSSPRRIHLAAHSLSRNAP